MPSSVKSNPLSFIPPVPPLLALALGVFGLVLLYELGPESIRMPGFALIVGLAGLTAHRDTLQRALKAAESQSSIAKAELESQIETQRARFEALTTAFDSVPTPTLVISSAGRVMLCNPAARGLVGQGEMDLISRELEELFPQPELLTLFDQARLGTPALARQRLVLHGETRYFDVSAIPIPSDLFADPEPSPTPDEESSAVVLCLEDVTMLAESVQLKTDFAANASHELRTPIAAIRGAVETLAVATDDPEMTQRLTGMIARHASRLEDLVEDLLDLSRLEAESKAPLCEGVDLQALVRNIEGHTQGTRESRRVGLAFSVAPELAGLQLDPRLLELILRNLIDNACKFAREGTTVVVECGSARLIPGTEPLGHRVMDSDFDGLRVRVIDRGKGIPLKHQERVFERFFQVDPGRDAQRASRGTGLGLAIVKHAVRQLAGRIEIQSVLHEGTTVTVEIPHCIKPISGSESHI